MKILSKIMNRFTLLILCAGFGKRMLDLTKNIPKPLLQINDQVLLGNSINFFCDIGCDEIFINTHYLHKQIENYLNKNYSNYPIKLIYEPAILGTGGAIKNSFNYTNRKNICVVNSDIFWKKNNKQDITDFLKNTNDIHHCNILLSKTENFYGLKKNFGDFSLNDGIISNWQSGSDMMFYTGCQIVSKNIFENTNMVFPINLIWKKLIKLKKLHGKVINSDIFHIGDKKSFEDI